MYAFFCCYFDNAVGIHSSDESDFCRHSGPQRDRSDWGGKGFPAWLVGYVILTRSIFLSGLSFYSSKMGELNLVSKVSNSSKIQWVKSETLVRSKALEHKLLQQGWRRAGSQNWLRLHGQAILLPARRGEAGGAPWPHWEVRTAVHSNLLPAAQLSACR